MKVIGMEHKPIEVETPKKEEIKEPEKVEDKKSSKRN